MCGDVDGDVCVCVCVCVSVCVCVECYTLISMSRFHVLFSALLSYLPAADASLIHTHPKHLRDLFDRYVQRGMIEYQTALVGASWDATLAHERACVEEERKRECEQAQQEYEKGNIKIKPAPWKPFWGERSYTGCLVLARARIDVSTHVCLCAAMCDVLLLRFVHVM